MRFTSVLRVLIVLGLCVATCASVPAERGQAAQAPVPVRDADVYVVPFSHLDLYWAGTREECLSRGNRIITKALRFAMRYPQFRFLIEDEVFLSNYVDTHQGTPELEQLKRLVKEGRVEISPKWAAILQNLPRGEAWVHNVLLGKRYARDVFGVDPLVANLGDLPGYTSQFPQILVRSHVPYMVMTRMGPADKSLFYYKALDGSKVLTWNTLKGYGWGTFITSKTLTDDQKRARLQKDLADVGQTTTGPILMHWGTDLWAPADGLVEAIERFNTASPQPRLMFATPTEFFRRAEKTAAIPETSGEIPHAWANILSSVIHLWPPAMAATDTLLAAEKFAAINYALGYAAYPQEELKDLWKKILEAMDHNNFGQGGEPGDARKLEYANMGIVRGHEILRDMLRNIAERVKSPFARSMPIVVFNPLSWTRDDVVHAHVSLYGDAAPGDIPDYRKAVRLVDETGTSIPFYIEQSSGTVSRALEIVFLARDVPSLGYKTYFVIPADQPDAFPVASKLTLDVDESKPKRVVGVDQIENEFYRVTVDRKTGAITVFDRELDRVVAKDMEIVASEERGGDSLSKEVVSGRTVINTVNRVEIEENNPVRTVVRIDGDLGGVPIVQRLLLYRGAKRVDLENTVHWSQGRLMRIEQTFPYEHPDAQIQYGIPFGAIDGSNFLPKSEPRAGDEIGKDFWKQWRQIQDWMFAGTAEWGLTIAADRQVVTLAPGVIRAGMLRGTYSAVEITRHEKPFLKEMPPVGTYVFRYSLSSGKGNWAAAKSYRSGMALNNPLIPISPADDLSRKSLPPTRSFCALNAGNIVISAVKKSDRDSAVIVRAFETEGSPADTSIEFLGRRSRFREVDLLEEALPSGEQHVLNVRPYEIRTLEVQAGTAQTGKYE
jgi:alpha-mannosidase